MHVETLNHLCKSTRNDYTGPHLCHLCGAQCSESRGAVDRHLAPCTIGFLCGNCVGGFVLAKPGDIIAT